MLLIHTKIGWGFDYYNLNEDSALKKKSLLYSLTDSANAANAETLNGNYNMLSLKSYYNGSFEEIIPFDDSYNSKELDLYS